MCEYVYFEELEYLKPENSCNENYYLKKKRYHIQLIQMNASTKVKFSHMTQLLMNTQQIFLDSWEVITELFLPKTDGLYGKSYMSSSFTTIRH